MVNSIDSLWIDSQNMKMEKTLRKVAKNSKMQAVKSSGSKIEIKLGKALWRRGLRYRKNNKKVFGTPDFTINKFKIAIFADSEFWHGKDWELKKHDHKSNIEFWHKKIERNIMRDREVNERLKKEGWVVIRFWGKEINNDADSCAEKIIQLTRCQK